MKAILVCLVVSLLSGSALAQCLSETKFIANDGDENDWFGWAIDANGNRLICGAIQDEHEGPNTGSAYVYRYDGTMWIRESKLLPGAGGEGSQFGQSVSIFSETVLVGAHGDETQGTSSGAAYIFRKDGNLWVKEQKLLPSDGALGWNFGNAVQINGNLAVVGARGAKHAGNNSGAAYVFRFDPDNNTWNEEAILLAPDAQADDSFGWDVAISDDLVVIGAMFRDSVYVFRATESGWDFETKLVEADQSHLDFFGAKVSIRGETVFISAYADDTRGSSSGAVYVFRRTFGEWIEKQKIIGSDTAHGDGFGIGMAANGNFLIAGSYGDNEQGEHTGAAYLFRETSDGWIEISKLVASDAEGEDRFGWSVAIMPRWVVSAAHLENENGFRAGAWYAYDLRQCSGYVESAEVVVGDLVYGNATSIRESDNIYLRTLSGFGSTVIDLHNMELHVGATVADATAELMTIIIESRIEEPAGTAIVSLRNWSTGEFEQVGQYSIGTGKRRRRIEDIQAGNYVNDLSEIEISIKHIVFAPFFAFRFNSMFDQVEVFGQ